MLFGRCIQNYVLQVTIVVVSTYDRGRHVP